jgi:hypothetical protein
MRRTHLIFPICILIPTVAFALQFAPPNTFRDVRPEAPEAAAIGLLKQAGIVDGYADGRFGISRRINRAEFLKIALKSFESGGQSVMEAKTCFDDVRTTDWFSPFVCAAKERGIVNGRTPEKFWPADTVSYGEALAILVRLYAYDVEPISGGDWAEQYYRSAAAKQVDLPVTIRLESPLSRGSAARLVAAFFAEAKGELDVLRLAEAGSYPTSSSESSVSSSNTSSSAMSSSLSSTSSAPAAALFTLPPVSHFLVVGRPSDAIASITLRSAGERSRIAAVQVKLANESRSILRLELVTLSGAVVAELPRRTTSDTADYKQRFEAQLAAEQPWYIPADTDVPLVVRAVIRDEGNMGFADDLVEVRTLTVTLLGDPSNETKTSVGVSPFPQHQTAFGRIKAIERFSGQTGVLASGSASLVGAYAFTADVLQGKAVGVEGLVFSVEKAGGVTVTNWRINQAGSTAFIPCSVGQDGLVTCTKAVDSLGIIPAANPLVLELRADVAVDPAGGAVMLQASLSDTGSPSVLGSVRWTDQSGHYRWVEGVSPVVRGTRWQ